MSSPNPPLFPMFVKLADRRCVVVGGGTIAESKVESLLVARADVTVVSPTLTVNLAGMQRSGTIHWCSRRFDPCDLSDVFVVIVATSDDAVNEAVYREAERRGVLCNAVDQPQRCHFYFPAVVQRGDLQIAISTAGQSPSLARRLREELEATFGPEYGEWVHWLGEVRKSLMGRAVSFDTRKRVLGFLARQESFERWLAARRRKSEIQEAA